ncbi:GAF domain-containing sensor histidine kinase [Streptomyces diastaticus]|uniref:GAF domain-containing sensor histidine kinase n=1 Tax=Streptomyces diastaticus TaxID=1956 RepID=UPI0036629BA4
MPPTAGNGTGSLSGDAPAAPPGPHGMTAEPAVRIPRLLEAMRSAGTGTEPHHTLDRLGETAAELCGARYAAIGVLAGDGRELSDFVRHDVDDATARVLGHLPGGQRGLLGAPVHDSSPVRLADLTTDPRSCGFPPHHPGNTFLGVPVRVADGIFGNLCLAEKQDGAEFTEEDLQVLRVLATEAGIAVGNARLHVAARQRERWINGSVAVITALLSGGDADEVLAVVAEQARHLADAQAGIVLLATEEGSMETVAASSRAGEAGGAMSLVIPADSELVRELLAGRPVLVEDATSDPRVRTEAGAGFGPSMMLPLVCDDRVLGALATPRSVGARHFTEAEQALAARFATQAAPALRMAEAQRDRERLAVLEDRDRIARDLHDLVIQRLFATGMMLETAQRRSGVPTVQEGLGRAVHELDVTIQEIRAAIFALQPGPADAPAGLRTRILREISLAAVPLGFTPAHRILGPLDTLVGETTGRNLVAALREALSNVFRHSGAGRVEVVVDAGHTLPDGAPGVRLTVADDGVGIAEGGRRSGLRNLQRRAESLGGTSWYGPGIGEDGAGTSVVWEAAL